MQFYNGIHNMKLKPLLLSLCCLLPFCANADWINVGKGDYNWGPFHVYSLALYSETGNYQAKERPVMLSFHFDKQIEGKNFAVSLIKEIERLKLNNDKKQWLEQLQQTLPDFSPNDYLNFIALDNKGYFVLNDTVLNSEFDPEFSQALLDSWLSEKASDKNLRKQLLEQPSAKNEPASPQPENQIFDEEESTPQLPPRYEQLEQQLESSLVLPSC